VHASLASQHAVLVEELLLHHANAASLKATGEGHLLLNHLDLVSAQLELAWHHLWSAQQYP